VAAVGDAVFAGGSVQATNSIVRRNTDGAGAPVAAFSVGAAATFCNCEPAWPGAGNLDANPQFRDAPNGDFHLLANSPCVDAGDNAAVTSTFDFDGEARIAGAAVDMGADEYVPCAWPGSGEDLTLGTTVNASGAPHSCEKVAATGDLLTMSVASPSGRFTFAPYLLLVELYPTGGTPPPPIPGLPALHVHPLTAIWLVDPLSPGPLGPAVLPAGGAPHAWFVPPGLTGATLRLQAGVFSPLAANGVFALTDAHEVDVQ
ncbi:MAG: hypothetical protein KAI24_00965, partial [Planctomycetes bacterium]|nr:hypothetical protein [Planctomycetota bacterium]